MAQWATVLTAKTNLHPNPGLGRRRIPTPAGCPLTFTHAIIKSKFKKIIIKSTKPQISSLFLIGYDLLVM